MPWQHVALVGSHSRPKPQKKDVRIGCRMVVSSLVRDVDVDKGRLQYSTLSYLPKSKDGASPNFQSVRSLNNAGK